MRERERESESIYVCLEYLVVSNDVKRWYDFLSEQI